MIVAGTGHRPQKCSSKKLPAFSKLQENVMLSVAKAGLKELQKDGPVDFVISGGALGWDTAIARAAYILEIPFKVYIPFLVQEAMWSREQQETYYKMLELAAETRQISPGRYSAAAMQRRNERMVEDANIVLALWSGASGGTANCIKFAQQEKRTIHNLWQEYSKYL